MILLFIPVRTYKTVLVIDTKGVCEIQTSEEVVWLVVVL